MDFVPQNGLYVEVESETGFGAGGELIADEVELEDREDGDEVEGTFANGILTATSGEIDD